MQGTSLSTKLKARSNGQALIIALLAIALLTVASAMFTKIIFAERSMSALFASKEKAFYMAEAGIEHGKSIIASNPNWFTDNPHVPDGDINWLIDHAKGSVNELAGGRYKIIRESGKNIIYSVGYSGSGRSVIKIDFIIAPFAVNGFKIL